MPTSDQEWKTRDGQVIHITNMEDSHLINSMLYLHRRRAEGSDQKKAWSWQRVVTLANELQRRGKLADPLSENELIAWLDTRMAEQDRARAVKWRTPYHQGVQQSNRQRTITPTPVPTPRAGVREAPTVVQPATTAPLVRKLDFTDW